jgi:hypothetical protein
MSACNIYAIDVKMGARLRAIRKDLGPTRLHGKPTWTLPRRLALAFLPTTAAVLLVAIVLRGGAHSLGRSLTLTAALLSAHLLHLRCIYKTQRAS